MSNDDDDIFEKTFGSLDIEASDNEQSDNETLEPVPEEEQQEPQEKPKKEKKKRKPMSDERKKQLLLNLQKGRETAKLNRMKIAKAKKIKKLEKDEEIDNIILEHVKKSKSKRTKEDELQEEINNLKKQLENKNVKISNNDEKKPLLEKVNKKTVETIHKEQQKKPVIKGNFFNSYWN